MSRPRGRVGPHHEKGGLPLKTPAVGKARPQVAGKRSARRRQKVRPHPPGTANREMPHPHPQASRRHFRGLEKPRHPAPHRRAIRLLPAAGNQRPARTPPPPTKPTTGGTPNRSAVFSRDSSDPTKGPFPIHHSLLPYHITEGSAFADKHAVPHAPDVFHFHFLAYQHMRPAAEVGSIEKRGGCFCGGYRCFRTGCEEEPRDQGGEQWAEFQCRATVGDEWRFHGAKDRLQPIRNGRSDRW